MISEGPYTLERLSPVLWKVVEGDSYGQYPFMYVIRGKDKCVLIDTGCGTGNLRGFLERHINTDRLPWLVICTHVHFDHAGGCFMFSHERHDNVIGICFSGADPRFTENYELTSLGVAHGATVRPFTVDRWLEDGDLFYLDDENPTEANEIKILRIPGHCIDHLAVQFPRERRLFVGDTVYPFTALAVSALGSNVPEFIRTLRRLRDVAETMNRAPTPPVPQPEGEGGGGEGGGEAGDRHETEVDEREPDAEARTPRETAAGGGEGDDALEQERERERLARVFVQEYMGLDWDTAVANFDPMRLLEQSDDSLDTAFDLFQGVPEGLAEIAPPLSYRWVKDRRPAETDVRGTAPAAVGGGSGAGEERGASASSGRDLPHPPVPSTTTLACGHVDPALEAVPALEELLNSLTFVAMGAVEPTHADAAEGTNEYNFERFSIVLPNDVDWEGVME